jgi:G3E family GTPase
MFQTEKADVIVLNKCDLIDGKIDMKHLEEIVLAFNPQSSIQQTTFGQVPLQSILGVAKGESVAVSGVVDDHRGFVSVAIQAIPQVDEDCTNPGCMGTSHTHTHIHTITMTPSQHLNLLTHTVTTRKSACIGPSCNDPNHSHVHSHHPKVGTLG